jgi:hypothetical protein
MAKRTLIVSFHIEERSESGAVTHSDSVDFELPGTDDSMLDVMKEMMNKLKGMELLLAQVKQLKGL